MAYDSHKHLAKITVSDKVLYDSSFETASNPEYDGDLLHILIQLLKREQQVKLIHHLWITYVVLNSLICTY